MSYTGLIKRLRTPPDWTAPTVLTYGAIRAEAITREHLTDDVRGIKFRQDDSFTYAVYAGEQYLGCCYPYPLGSRTPVTEFRSGFPADSPAQEVGPPPRSP